MCTLSSDDTGLHLPNCDGAGTSGSRRRRLWELDSHAHCPVLGVCMPMASLRRVVGKAVGGQMPLDDYELHCTAVTACKHRSQLAEALHKELERRYALTVRRAGKAKSTEMLETLWAECAASGQVAGALWALLTHARCTPELESRVLGDVHMLQHQAGMATRVDAERFDELIDENAVLARELGAAQQRSTRQAADHARQLEHYQATCMQLRAELIGRDTLLSQLREQMQALEDAAPDLRSRFELARDNQRQLAEVRELQRTVSRWQQEADRQRRRAEEAAAQIAQRTASPPNTNGLAQPLLADLSNRAVLCVGGRAASVPVYRRLIERTGGRFLHHDGGDEESPGMLDATLAAADLIICQTGCISHDAYWRVKNHCKRTGKRCLFVEIPSRTGLARALATAHDAAGLQEEDA